MKVKQQQFFTNINDFAYYCINLTKTSRVKHSYLTMYEELVKHTNFLPITASIKQRAWHVINNDYIVHNCKMCSNSVSWNTTKQQYSTFCSMQCRNNDFTTTNIFNIYEGELIPQVIGLSGASLRVLRMQHNKL